MMRVGSRQEEMQIKEDSLDQGAHLYLGVCFGFDLSTRKGTLEASYLDLKYK